MTLDEAAISRLTDAINTVEPHIAALHDRVINHGDRTACERLAMLINAASRMIDAANREDFMNVAHYERIAAEG